MKNLFKIFIVLILIINILILPSTNSKFVKNQEFKFSASAETPYVEIHTHNSELPLENGGFGVKYIVENTGYYGIIAKGSSGSPDSDLTKNEGGVIACYVLLNRGDVLYGFIPALSENGNQNANSFGIGAGSKTKITDGDNIGGAATVITLNQLSDRKNLLVIAAGSGAGARTGTSEMRGGGGGSNVELDSKFADHYTARKGEPVSIPVPGTVFDGFVGGTTKPKWMGSGGTIYGGKAATYSVYNPENGTSIFDGGTGSGGWFGGGGGYAGGGGASHAYYAGGGGSSFLADIAHKMPQNLYVKLRDENKSSSGKTLEREKSGYVMFTFLGTDESKITAFGN